MIYVDGLDIHNMVMDQMLEVQSAINDNFSSLSEEEKLVMISKFQTLSAIRMKISKYLDTNEVTLEKLLKDNNITLYKTPAGKTKAKKEVNPFEDKAVQDALTSRDLKIEGLRETVQKLEKEKVQLLDTIINYITELKTKE